MKGVSVMKGWHLFSQILQDNFDNPNQCWNWTGKLNKKGYGRFRFNGVTWLAHRYSYAKLKGKIGGMYVLHNCDNPSCINPNHLKLGTAADNAKDAASKDRMSKKLSHKDVKKILQLKKQGMNMKDITKLFNVEYSMISRICNGSRRKIH